jgi:hydroxyacylglutathione hydrolase
MISISPIPIFNDNYVWLIEHDNADASVVDPGDAAPVLKILHAKGLTLTSILITHHHWDHTGGIKDLVDAYPDIIIYGPNSEKIPQVTQPQKNGDEIDLFGDQSLTLNIIEVPGHTSEHIAYFAATYTNSQNDGSSYDEQTSKDSTQSPILFSGDTLFAGGCGRLLGGTAEQLCRSLKILSALPSSTCIYCTHEYTLANLAFAKTVEPSNEHIKSRIHIESVKRSNDKPTLPSTIELEQQTNPFLRCLQTEVMTTINQHWGQSWKTEQELFTGLRRWKDNF